MSLESAVMAANVQGDNLSPTLATSNKYKHWLSIKDDSRCTPCAENHGKIWLISENSHPKPPAHRRCRCVIDLMQTILAGTATINEKNGADWMLMFDNRLPNYYISQKELEFLGWQKGNKPSKFANKKMLFGGIYKNLNEHLPQKVGRVWYEADINYKSGKRNSQRIVWSNDGLIFVTYDHYKTFYEII